MNETSDPTILGGAEVAVAKAREGVEAAVEALNSVNVHKIQGFSKEATA